MVSGRLVFRMMVPVTIPARPTTRPRAQTTVSIISGTWIGSWASRAQRKDGVRRFREQELASGMRT